MQFNTIAGEVCVCTGEVYLALAVSGRSMPRPYGLSRLTDELYQRLEQPWLLVWPHAQDAMLAGR